MQTEQVPPDYQAAFLALAVAVTEAYTLARFRLTDDAVIVEKKLTEAFSVVQSMIVPTCMIETQANQLTEREVLDIVATTKGRRR